MAVAQGHVAGGKNASAAPGKTARRDLVVADRAVADSHRALIVQAASKSRRRSTPITSTTGRAGRIACNGAVDNEHRSIVADPGTITGSIGVITGKLVVRDLLQRLGVGLDTVRTNANADP